MPYPYPDDENQLAPEIILGARQLRNPEGIAPRMDTEGPPPTRMPVGAKLEPIPTHSDAKMNIDNVDPEHAMEQPGMVREASARNAPPEGNMVMNDAGAQPAPDTSALPASSHAAPETSQSKPELAPLDQSGLAGHALAQEGQTRHAAKLREFGDAEAHLNAGLLKSPDEFSNPTDYTKYLTAITAGRGALKQAKAEYELSHPWGAMESAHPGVFGKIGHAFGQIGNVAGEAFAPGLAEAIPGSHANLENQVAEGEAGVKQAIGEQTAIAGGEQKGAAADLAQAKIPTEAAKQQQNIAQAGLADAKTGVVAQKPEVEAIHDLMTGDEGKPRINPVSQKPYTYAEAYMAAQMAGKQPKTLTPEQQFIEEYQKSHPNASMDEVIRAYTQATTRPEKASTGNARSDKSYQFQVGRLDKIRKPIDDLATRFSRLNDTLAQHSPQADALIAPELLTVMAGGQGSGLRMNEAEISRIIGGRSAWENLKGKIQHWSTNPDDARSITPDQDRQIRALMSAVNTKLTTKQRVIDEANDKLINSEDPEEHRRIVAETQHHLDQVDSGGAAGGTVKVQIPGHPPGSISQDKLEEFKRKYPNAQVIQ